MSDYDTSSVGTDLSSVGSTEDTKFQISSQASADKSVSLGNSDTIKHPSELSENESNDNATSKIDKWEDILGSGSLMKKVIVEGKPDSRPQRLENCIINYECTLEDGKLIEKKEKFKVQLGDYEVIQGLDLALGLMNVGEVSKLKIEARLAYGQKGFENRVPPDTTVHYTVELLEVVPDDEPEQLTITQRRLKGNEKRERGNRSTQGKRIGQWHRPCESR